MAQPPATRSASKTSEKLLTTSRFTVSISTFLPVSLSIEVIVSGSRPHGLIRLEVAQVGVHIEGEPVVGDPVGHGDADRGELLLSDPDPGVVLLAAGFHREAVWTAMMSTSSSDLTKPPDVWDLHLDDRVADELSGPW